MKRAPVLQFSLSSNHYDSILDIAYTYLDYNTTIRQATETHIFFCVCVCVCVLQVDWGVFCGPCAFVYAAIYDMQSRSKHMTQGHEDRGAKHERALGNTLSKYLCGWAFDGNRTRGSFTYYNMLLLGQSEGGVGGYVVSKPLIFLLGLLGTL